MNKCKRCGRKLKNKHSIMLGYGHVCGIKEGIILKKQKVYKRSYNNTSLFEFEAKYGN